MASNIANLPKSLKIRTSDNEVVEVTGKLINESLVIKELFEKNGNGDANEMTIQVKSAELKNAVKVLELCDLETPPVSISDFRDRETFESTNLQALEFLKSIPGDEMVALCNLSCTLEVARLRDLCAASFARIVGDSTVEGIRELFGLRNDYTEEEEEEFHKRHESVIG
uniref:Skp1 domain-containing protein n=1 Tax=Panagrellus redivivus TaxID=6233 RepID=A0A7E4ZUY7_PANRE